MVSSSGEPSVHPGAIRARVARSSTRVARGAVEGGDERPPGPAGPGGFTQSLSLPVGTPATAFGRFDGDQSLDLAVLNAGAGEVPYLRGRGDGTFDAPQALVVGIPTRGFATADFNGPCARSQM